MDNSTQNSSMPTQNQPLATPPTDSLDAKLNDIMQKHNYTPTTNTTGDTSWFKPYQAPSQNTTPTEPSILDKVGSAVNEFNPLYQIPKMAIEGGKKMGEGLVKTVTAKTPEEGLAGATQAMAGGVQGFGAIPFGLFESATNLPGVKQVKNFLMGQDKGSFPVWAGDKISEWKALQDFVSNHPQSPEIAANTITTLLGLGGLKYGTEGELKNVTSKVGDVASTVESKVGGGISNIKDIATSGSQLTKVHEELASLPMQELSLQNQLRDVRFSSKGSLRDMTNSFKETSQTLQDTLSNEAKLQSAQNKGTLQTLFRDMTTTYGKGLNQAEQALTEKGVTIRSDDYLKEVVNRTIENAKNQGIPEDNPSLQILKNSQDKFSSEVQTQMKLSDLIKMKNEVYDTLTAEVKKGTAYSSAEDLVANSFLRNYGEFIGQMSPELKQLNTEFAPMAQARSWAMKNFKPYNPAEIQKGANVLTQIASGKTPNQTSLNYLKTLSEGSGQFGGAGDLTGKTTEIGKNIQSTKEMFDTAKQNLISSTDFQINKLQTEKASLKQTAIELGQRADQLKQLKKVRNWIVGLTFAAVGGEVIKGKAQGLLNLIP